MRGDKEPLNKKMWNADLVPRYSDAETTVFLKRDVKAAVEWYIEYSDSGREIFKEQFPDEYAAYVSEGKSAGWCTESDESWNCWLLQKAFPDVMKNE